MKTLIIASILNLFTAQGIFTQNDSFINEINPIELSSEEIYSRCSDAVVMIYKYDGNNALLGYGSGVIVSGSGLVYTNYHVVENASRIEIRNGNDIYDSVPFAGFDPFNDAAILKLPEGNYPYINISKDNDNKIGSSIYALGNPQGYTKTISYGIISALRSNENLNQIQFTAPIAPGSSGGALLNTRGELIGITASCVTTGQNMNFAIPINILKSMAIVDLRENEQSFLFKQMFSLYTYSERISFDSTVMIISQYCDLYNNDTAKWEFAGQFYSKQGEYDSAIACYSRGIELNNTNKFLYKYRADCYAQKSDTFKALSDYQSSLTLCSTYLQAYIERAKYFQYTLKDYKRAIEDYEMVLKINPEYDFVYTEKASCKLNLDDKEGAIQELGNSLLWKDDNPVLYRMRAEIYSTLKMYDNAISDYSMALYKSPMEIDSYLSRAILYSKIDDPVSAIRDYQEYIKYEVDDPTAYNNMAYAYMSIEDYNLAEYNFNQALKYSKFHFDSYLGLSILNIRQGKTKASISNMCKAIEIQDLLLFGKPGIDKLEDNGWFWDSDEKKDMKKIFKIMGITNRKVEPSENKEPKSRRVKREAAERNIN
ncbi:MAG: trypsin-like peptidase domain-containing protein [Ignavibacteria bacterium]